MPRARRNKEPSPRPEESEVEVEVDENGNDDGVDDEMDVDQSSAAHTLQFDEAVTWRAGRPIPVADLLRRLQTLYEELKDVDQEDADRKTISPKAQELASPLLLGHKDGGVKAWTLLCIVEMFRLLAPDAPYKSSQLKDIFNLVVSTFVPALANPTDAYNAQHLKIVESLNSIKSIVLLVDVPGADQLMLNLFTNCFDVLAGTMKGSSGEQLSKNVEFNLTGMLVTLIDEATVLPPGVLEVMLAQFLRADPSLQASKKGEAQKDVTLREVPAPYNMARSVCNSCHEKMGRYIGSYFNTVMIDATEAISTAKPTKTKTKKRAHDDSDNESDSGLISRPSEKDMEEVAKAHRLLRELWRSCPDVVRNVIPQIEAELGAESISLRTLAVQTVGDMVSGIGAAGPPPPAPLEPAAYPSQSLAVSSPVVQNVLLRPAAPQSFSSVYSTAYELFFSRGRDKSAQVRSAWATEVGRILVTSGGGKGLDRDQEAGLVKGLSDMLMDQDDKVRLAAVQAVATLDYHTIIQKLGSAGGTTTEGSVLANLTDRIKDQKQPVRSAAIQLAGRIWGVAAGAIVEGNERARELVGTIPSRILDAFYVNDRTLNADVQLALHESLLPVGFPGFKPKAAASSDSQRVNDSQGEDTPDPDRIRVERTLALVRDLESKAQQVFFALQVHQASKATYLVKILDEAETIKGDFDKKSNKDSTKQIDAWITALSAFFPDPSIAHLHLESFARHYDRRNYTLAKFATSQESEYRKVTNAMKELSKRLEGNVNTAKCLETVIPFLRSAAVLVYNRSHVPAIIEISRTDDKGLASAAQSVIAQIAEKAPQVFKVHVKDLCDTLKKGAPTPTSPNDPAAADSLKACAGFARKFPKELGQDREFYQAMTKFASQGTPPRAAKHAVTVVISAADKKDMYIKEIVKTCTKNFKVGSDGYLAKLASLGQLRLLAAHETEDQHEAIDEIATDVIGETIAGDQEDAPQLDDDDKLTAKLLSLKILVNSLRGQMSESQDEPWDDEVKAHAGRVFRLLNTLVEKEGELSKDGNSTPKHYRIQLRLAAAKLILKLCCHRALEKLFKYRDYNRLAKVAQDVKSEVRAGFNDTLKKYLSQGKLGRKYYGLLFLYAHEPSKSLKERTTTFLKSRVATLAKADAHGLEGVLSYFFSLLAHHQDFSIAIETDQEELAAYVLFYLKIVANEQNLPQLYNVALRLKSIQDGIDPEKSENLYILGEMSEAMMRYYAENKGWSLQITPAKVKMPSGIYAAMPNHAVAQEISDKTFLPEQLVDSLEDIVKEYLHPRKKRKTADSSTQRVSKKAKVSNGHAVKQEKVRKTPKAPKAPKPAKVSKMPKKRPLDDIPASERRKSARVSNAKSYADGGSSDDDDELEHWQEESGDDEANKENLTSTPPTSDPTPAAAPEKDATPKASKVTQKKKAAPIAKQLPSRGRSARAAKKKDEFDMPSDSEELSEAPSEMEA
ncbi:Sister chromatid cohesion protein pds5 [Fulvia fulva]|nr:Sister chromatid cohesion protein pds5 [Fulvia fulva]